MTKKTRTTEIMLLAVCTATAHQPACRAAAGDASDAQPAASSIVKNGGFEEPDPADNSKPAYWFKPDGLGVQWVRLPDAHGMAIRMDTSVSELDMVAQWKKTGLNSFWDVPKPEKNPIAATYGLSYYSDAIPVSTGQAYRVEFDYRSEHASSGAMVWVRCYGLFRGEMRRRYEKIVNCYVKDDKWHHFSETFYPTKLRPEITEMKVMLFAYWPPGIYLFDNVEIRPVPLEELK